VLGRLHAVTQYRRSRSLRPLDERQTFPPLDLFQRNELVPIAARFIVHLVCRLELLSNARVSIFQWALALFSLWPPTRSTDNFAAMASEKHAVQSGGVAEPQYPVFQTVVSR
jgi:hypothetical protein